ncbi:hypothetical protein GS506_04290 [Rhodococcus hoagii]|nr:hypothetical protein [Prescottella equi]
MRRGFEGLRRPAATEPVAVEVSPRPTGRSGWRVTYPFAARLVATSSEALPPHERSRLRMRLWVRTVRTRYEGGRTLIASIKGEG